MEEQKPKSSGSKIGNLEWGLVIGAVAIVDAVQLFLNVFAIGVLANRFIDIVVGMALAFYFWIRGIKMNAKKVLSLIASFVGEEIPVLDTLPLWTLDVILIMAWDKAEGKIEKALPILNKTLGQAEGISGRIEGMRNKQITPPTTSQNDESRTPRTNQYQNSMNNVLDLQKRAPQTQPETTNDINHISKMRPLRKDQDIPEYSDRVYRELTMPGAHENLEDIEQSGLVRSRLTALGDKAQIGVNHTADNKVWWTRGTEGRSYSIPKEGYVLEAHHEKAQQGILKKDNLIAIHKKDNAGKVSNILEEPGGLRAEIARNKSLRESPQAEKPKI